MLTTPLRRVASDTHTTLPQTQNSTSLMKQCHGRRARVLSTYYRSRGGQHSDMRCSSALSERPVRPSM